MMISCHSILESAGQKVLHQLNTNQRQEDREQKPDNTLKEVVVSEIIRETIQELRSGNVIPISKTKRAWNGRSAYFRCTSKRNASYCVKLNL